MSINATSNQAADRHESEVSSAQVLLVAENPVDRELALAILEQYGCSVSLAAGAAEAISSWLGYEFDLILMDCFLPRVDGYETARDIRRRESERNGKTTTPIIGLTMDNTDEEHNKCLEAGMNDCVARPFEPADFSQVISRWTDWSQAKHTDESRPAMKAFVVDQKALDRIRELETPATPDILNKVVQLYISETPGLLESIDEAIASGDSAAMRRAAHSLKSSSATVGALAVSALCKEIEDLGRDERFDGAERLFDEVRLGFGSIKNQLEGVLTSVAGA